MAVKKCPYCGFYKDAHEYASPTSCVLRSLELDKIKVQK